MFPILNPPPSPFHPSGSSQCTSPKYPVSCIEPGLAIHFTYDIIHVSMPFSEIIPPFPSPTESKRLFYTSVSLLLSLIQGYRYHLSKFHIYVLVYCIGVSFVLKIRTPGSPNPRDTTSKSHSVLLGKERNVIFFFFFQSSPEDSDACEVLMLERTTGLIQIPHSLNRLL